MKRTPLVSVVITTKNEEKNIVNCLGSIRKQTYKNLETIVVDNRSADRTKQIARVYSAKVFNKGPERSAQRNFGAEKARGLYYLYLDADMILDKKLVEECVKKMEGNMKLRGLYIPEIIIGKGYWPKVRRFERSFYNGTVIDCVRFIRLTDFAKVKGFDESMSGPEDWDFDKKIRNLGNVDIIQSPLYHNEKDFSLSDYLKKKQYYIKSFDTYISKWGKDDPDIKKQLGPFYRMFFVFAENGKWRELLKHPILAFGMFVLRFLVGLNFLIQSEDKE